MADYGARIGSHGRITVPSHSAYNWGTGDFTVTALVQTLAPGTVVSRKPSPGGSGNGGFLLVIRNDGSIKLVTDNGFGLFEAVSVPTEVLNGEWHHIAGVRRGAGLQIYLDGNLLAAHTNGNATPPVNVNNSLRLMIGGTDQVGEPFNQFTGVLEDVTL